MRIFFILILSFVACLPPKALPKRRPNNESIKLRSELEISEENREKLDSKLDKIEEEKNKLDSENQKLKDDLTIQKKVFHLEQTKLKKQISKMKRPIIIKEVPKPEIAAPVEEEAVKEEATSTTTIPEKEAPSTTPSPKPKALSIPEYSPSDAP